MSQQEPPKQEQQQQPRELIKDGWFREYGTMWPGEAMTYEVKRVLLDKRSDYQHVLVLESASYGNMLVLDGAVQITDRDEFSYQEMIAHLPMCGHKNPERVLIIGGGDGGAMREVVRHSSVKEAHLCEIDTEVVRVSREYFPKVACGLDDKRVQVHYMDGALFLKQHVDYFDVIIVDSSDPVGPAETLYRREFYETARDALRAGGVLCTQAESIWLHLDLIKNMSQFVGQTFGSVSYAFTTIPTYPSGMIGFYLCSKESGVDHKNPVRELPEEVAQELRYYSPEVHRAAFVLPAFARRALKGNVHSIL